LWGFKKILTRAGLAFKEKRPTISGPCVKLF
jgi:hypothetical protein